MTAADEARLAQAEWLRRPGIMRIFAALGGEAGETRAVGGIVRDTLLDRPAGDIDMATVLAPETVLARAEAAGIATYPTGIAHGTVTLLADGQAVEVTSLREDVETDGRHAVVRFGTDWRRDAERRDFTLNALYCEADGRLFDPLGGVEDCLARHLRFIGDADRRIAEDRLRVLRFFRFSASHGEQRFDEAGLAACRRAAGTLGALSAERVGAEMLRMLGLPGVARTMQAMADAGLGQVPAESLPALARFEPLEPRPVAAQRLALLLAHEAAERVQARWRLSNAVVRQAESIAQAARLLLADEVGEAVYRAGAAAQSAVAVAGALADWPAARVFDMAEKLARTTAPVFPLSGRDLVAAGFLPGPRLGRELARLERAWIASGFTLGAQDLLAQTRR